MFWRVSIKARFVFFFQTEDGIRDIGVTGVQTCALPICVVEVAVHGLPPGLGSHVHWDRRLDARLAGALMGIQAIKGVEVGDGFALAAEPGSRAHDEIVGTPDGIRRTSGRSGGTEGGMTTGEVLRVRAAMKPIATVPRALRTVDVATGEAAVAHHQRSDVCAVPAAGIVAERSEEHTSELQSRQYLV